MTTKASESEFWRWVAIGVLLFSLAFMAFFHRLIYRWGLAFLLVPLQPFAPSFIAVSLLYLLWTPRAEMVDDASTELTEPEGGGALLLLLPGLSLVSILTVMLGGNSGAGVLMVSWLFLAGLSLLALLILGIVHRRMPYHRQRTVSTYGW